MIHWDDYDESLDCSASQCRRESACKCICRTKR